jgi:hypothetical protein
MRPSFFVLGFVLALAAPPTAAQGVAPEADRILARMSDHLAEPSAFAVTAEAATDVVLEDGRKLQLTATGRRGSTAHGASASSIRDRSVRSRWSSTARR